jgi:hypothetical protein
MEPNGNTQVSIGWMVAETLVASGAVVATIAGFGMALQLVIGAVRLAVSFVG